MFKLNNKNNIKDSAEVIKSVNKKTSIPSIINSEMEVKGVITSDNIIEVFGKIEGVIKADVLSVREGASVKGEVVAKYVKISGIFEGDISSSIIHITSTGVVSGKMHYGVIAIEEKAKFDGTLKQTTELLEVKDIKEVQNKENE
jgi:cytoskeletal protein CcmA (bactofilin family)